MQIINTGKDGSNSYILKGKKTAVIECMGKEYAEYHLERIREAAGGDAPDYIILNSVSPDNAGTAGALLERYPDAKIVASAAGVKNLGEILNSGFDYILAKDDAVLELGGCSLLFKILPDLPWTDSMASYCAEAGVLFCGSIFRDEDGYFEKYIAPYRAYANNAAKRLAELDITRMLPSFGGEIPDIGGVLRQYSEPEEKNGTAAVFYASRYGSTRQMAEVIAGTIEKNGIKTRLFDVNAVPGETLKKAIDTCAGFAVGTNTVNRNADPNIWRLITDIDMIGGKRRACMVFGSCGWSGEGVYMTERFLKSINMKMYKKPYLIKFSMSDSERAGLAETAEGFARMLAGEIGGE